MAASSPKRLLEFIYMDAGGGHRSAAMALSAVIAEHHPQWEARLVNLMEDILRPVDPLHRLTGTHRSEDIYNSMLKLNWTYGLTPAMRGLQQMLKLLGPAIEKLLRRHWSEGSRPDLVVSLIPHFNRPMYRALRRVRPGTPYVTVMTDLADCPPHFWQEKQDQFLVCGSDEAVRQARAAGYAESRVFRTSGMILKPQFYHAGVKSNRGMGRQRLGLDPDRPTALIMFGGHGAKAAEKIVRKLERSRLGVQCIVMCGRNKNLRRVLRRRKSCYPVGFTDKVPQYMALADFFIGKPGPGSISEALHMGLPLIVERNIRTMPQELFNTHWIEENKLGLVIRNFTRIGDAVRHLLEGNRLEKCRANAQRLRNRAVFEVPEIFGRIMGDPS